MPLLVITGAPASGKSTITKRIYDYFCEKSDLTVTIVSDEDSGNFTRAIYEDPRNERQQRDFLRSEVQRYLSGNSFVICDSLNYLKGFRYELYCVAKLVKTTYAVLFCKADEETVRRLNAEKELAERYDEKILNELRARFEVPQAKNRWEFPLFEVEIGDEQCFRNDGDNKQSLAKSVILPFDDLFSCLIKGKQLTENLSTVITPIITHDFIQTLEQVTKEITKSVFEQQNGAIVGNLFLVPHCSVSEKVIFKRQRTLAELSRLRRQFTSYIKKHPIEDHQKIASLFVNFLNSS